MYVCIINYCTCDDNIIIVDDGSGGIHIPVHFIPDFVHVQISILLYT